MYRLAWSEIEIIITTLDLNSCDHRSLWTVLTKFSETIYLNNHTIIRLIYKIIYLNHFKKMQTSVLNVKPAMTTGEPVDGSGSGSAHPGLIRTVRWQASNLCTNVAYDISTRMCLHITAGCMSSTSEAGPDENGRSTITGL